MKFKYIFICFLIFSLIFIFNKISNINKEQFQTSTSCKRNPTNCTLPSQQPQGTRPNFIFYLSDDQDRHDYEIYGNPLLKDETSAVTKLASEGVIFENFYTPVSTCAPSRSVLYSGMYPIKNGAFLNHYSLYNKVKTLINGQIEETDYKTITGHMKEAGYDVRLFGKSHVTPRDKFEWDCEYNSNSKDIPMSCLKDYLENVKAPFCIFIASQYPHNPYPSDSDDFHGKGRTQGRTISWFDKDQKPYRVNKYWESSNNEGYIRGYYENIRKDNVQLTDVLKHVDDNNFKDNTIFMYSSDHGISGKWTTSEQSTRVPFVMRCPPADTGDGVIWPQVSSDIGEIKKRVVTTTCTFADVLPTILDFAYNGIKNTSDTTTQSSFVMPSYIDGKSFKKVVNNDFTVVHPEIHSYIYTVANNQNVEWGHGARVFPSRAITDTTSRFKYVFNLNSLQLHDPDDDFLRDIIRARSRGLDDNKLQVYINNNYPLLGTQNKYNTKMEPPKLNLWTVNSFPKQSDNKQKIIKIGALDFKDIPFEQLYDLADDPWEQNNLLENPTQENQQRANTLYLKLKEWFISQSDYLMDKKDPMKLFIPTYNGNKPRRVDSPALIENGSKGSITRWPMDTPQGSPNVKSIYPVRISNTLCKSDFFDELSRRPLMPRWKPPTCFALPPTPAPTSAQVSCDGNGSCPNIDIRCTQQSRTDGCGCVWICK